MKRLQRVLDAIDNGLIHIAEFVLLGLLAMLFVSIMGRALINVSIPDQSIITEILMVALVFLALGHAQRVGAHLDVEVVAKLCPPKLKEAFRVFALLLGVVVIGGSTWFSAETAYASYVSDEVIFSSILYLEEWPGRFFVAIGLGWWTLRMAVEIFVRREPHNGGETSSDRPG